jgi:hypothetical protein
MSNKVTGVQWAQEFHAALRSAIAVALQETHTALMAPEMYVDTVNTLVSNDPRAEPSPTADYWRFVTVSLQKHVWPLFHSMKARDAVTSNESVPVTMDDVNSKTELSPANKTGLSEVNRVALDVALREQLMVYLVSD